MSFKIFSLQLVKPSELAKKIGVWVRVRRQQMDLTQAMLAQRAGVATSSLSRLESKGQGSIELLTRLLFALGESDILDEFIVERIRLARMPKDILQLPVEPKIPKRIHPRKK